LWFDLVFGLGGWSFVEFMGNAVTRLFLDFSEPLT
jgi:hypothetical protein